MSNSPVDIEPNANGTGDEPATAPAHRPTVSPAPSDVPPPDEPPRIRPYWWPAGLEPSALGDDVEAAVQATVEPLIRDTVLGSEDPLVRIAGDTLAVLQTSSIIQAVDLGESISQASPGDSASDPSKQLAAYIKLAASKSQFVRLLLQLRRVERVRDPLSRKMVTIIRK